jgi:hypothetical protein
MVVGHPIVASRDAPAAVERHTLGEQLRLQFTSLDDDVCRDVRASGRFSNGLRTGGFVQAGFFIRAEEREQPLIADIGVDTGQIRRQLAIHLQRLGEIPLDAEQGDRDLLLPSTAGGVAALCRQPWSVNVT